MILPPFNPARGEVSLKIGEQNLRLCLTLRALAALEAYFGVQGFEGLAASLRQIEEKDIGFLLRVLALKDVEVALSHADMAAALNAIVATFEAAAA